MTPDRYFTLVTEAALTDGRPLGEALAQSSRAAPPAPGPVLSALRLLQAGDQRAGLEALAPIGLDPLLVEAALLHPGSVRSVRERLAAIPERFPTLFALRGMLGYLLVVFVVQMGILAVVTQKVLPPLLHQAASSGSVTGIAQAMGWATLLAQAGALLCFAGLTGWGVRLLLRASLRSQARARLFAAAAGIAAVAPGAETARFLTAHPEITGLGTAPGAAVLDELAGQHGRLALLQAERVIGAVKVGGTVAALLVAGLAVAASFYLFLPTLGSGVAP